MEDGLNQIKVSEEIHQCEKLRGLNLLYTDIAVEFLWVLHITDLKQKRQFGHLWVTWTFN